MFFLVGGQLSADHPVMVAADLGSQATASIALPLRDSGGKTIGLYTRVVASKSRHKAYALALGNAGGTESGDDAQTPYVAIVDTSRLQVVGGFRLGGVTTSAAIALSPDETRLYVVDNANVTVYDTLTDAPLHVVPYGQALAASGSPLVLSSANAALSLDGSRLYFSASSLAGSSALLAFDTTALTVKALFNNGQTPLPVWPSGPFCASPDGLSLLGTTATGAVRRFTLATGVSSVLGTGLVDGDALAVSPDGTKVYVTGQDSTPGPTGPVYTTESLGVVALPGGAFTRAFQSGTPYSSVRLTGDGGQVVAARFPWVNNFTFPPTYGRAAALDIYDAATLASLLALPLPTGYTVSDMTADDGQINVIPPPTGGITPPPGGGGGGGGLTSPTGDLAGVVGPVPSTAGATITLSPGGLSATSASPFGGYAIHQVPVGDYTATFSDCGYYPVSLPVTIVANQTALLNATLIPLSAQDAEDGFLVGTLVDLITQAPIEGGVVTLTDTAGRVGGTATSDAQGAFFLKAAPNFYTLSVLAPGYDPFTSPAVYGLHAPCPTLAGLIGIPPPAIVEGDADIYGYTEDAIAQSPLAGVLVSLLEFPLFQDSSRSDGGYELRYVPAQGLTVTGSRDGYRPRRSTVTTTPGQSVRVDLGLMPSGSVSGGADGFVTDATTSLPIRGAVVRLPGVAQAVTNSQGYFLLSDIPTGAIALQAAADGYLAAQHTGTVASGVTLRVNFAMAASTGVGAGGVLYGQVRDAVSGAGLVGAAVGIDSLTGVSAARGAYLLSPVPVPPVAHTVTASDAGYHALSLSGVTVGAGESLALDLGLVSLSTPTGGVHGFVFDAQEPSLSVRGAALSLGPYLQTLSTSPSGEYLFPLVPAGLVYALRASADGYLPARIDGLTVANAKTLEVDVPLFSFSGLLSFGSLTVTVTLAGDGSPFPGASVDTGAPGLPVLTTGADGTASFPAVPLGPMTVVGTAPGYRVASRATTIVPGQNLAPLAMQGFPAGYVGSEFYGHVTSLALPPGAPVAGCAVTGSPAWATNYGQNLAVTDAAGFYVLDDAPASGNPYALTFDQPDYDLLTVAAVSIPRMAVRVDARLAPFDGRLPAGWTVVFSKAVALSRPVQATVFSLPLSGSATQALRATTTAYLCQEDTAQLSRYRRRRLDARVATTASTPLLRAALALAPGVTVPGLGVEAIPVPDPPKSS